MSNQIRFFQRLVILSCLNHAVGFDETETLLSTPNKLLKIITQYLRKLYEIADVNSNKMIDYGLLLSCMQLVYLALSADSDIIRKHSSDAALLRGNLHQFNSRIKEHAGADLIRTQLKDTIIAIAGELALYDNEQAKIQTIDEMFLKM